MTSTSKLIGCFVYLLMAVEAMEEQVQSAILRQSVIVFSEGISTPSKSDWTQDQHWVQKIGSENLHMKGKEQLRSLGEMQRRGMDAGGLMSLMEKDVVVYTQDRNISIIGSKLGIIKCKVISWYRLLLLPAGTFHLKASVEQR